MELSQLQYFRVIAKTEHITKAADMLHITQSALSHAISKLEAELDIKLFIRDGKRIRLSLAGELFLQNIDKAFDNIHAGIESMESLKENLEQEIHVSSFTGGLITASLEQFMKDYPNVAIQHSVLPHDVIKAGLDDGRIDIALTLFPIDSPFAEWKRIALDEFIFIMSAENELAEQTNISIEDLKSQKIAVTDPNCGVGAMIKNLCMSKGFKARIIYEGSDSDMVMNMVRNNQCVFAVPASLHIWKVLADKNSRAHGEEAQHEKPFNFIVKRFDEDYGFEYGLGISSAKKSNESVVALYNNISDYFDHWREVKNGSDYEELLKM